MADVGKDTAGPGSVELLQWSIVRSAQETTVALSGEVDYSSADGLTRLLEDLIAPDRGKVAIDLTRVSFLDSTGIKSLIVAAKTASDVGCAFVVRHPNSLTERVIAICGVGDLLLEDSDGRASADR
jgi:anti-sigma B factor antagonist